MNKTKKFLTAVLLVVMLIACVSLTACGKKVKVNFVYDEGQIITVEGKKGDTVDLTPAKSKDGYVFDGWYLTSDYQGSKISSATFDKDITYYAKWLAASFINLDAAGGTVPGNVTTITVNEGDNISEAVKSYNPVKGSLLFGGWYLNGSLLSEDEVASKGQIYNLVAKYQAEYTVKAYIQKTDLSGYDEIDGYVNGYVFVGESFFPEVSVEGCSLKAADKVNKTISENASDNVFVLHFDRNTYEVTYYESYPSGTPELKGKYEYVGGITGYLPSEKYSYDGYRMLGWANKMGGRYSDVIKPDAPLTENLTLYPVWEKGYRDLFNGEDYLFLNHDEGNTAVLVRGGVEIDGVYNSLYDFYFFYNEDHSFSVRAKLSGENFIFYGARAASYYLLPDLTAVNKNISIALDNQDGITYYDNSEGVIKRGSYVIEESGIYLATFEDGTSFEFTVGSFGKEPAFRIRGEEYKYGEIARRAMYYPTMTFDGFGNVIVKQSEQSATYSYTVSNGVFTVLSGSNSDSAIIKILDYNGTKGYDFYDGNYDKTYSNMSKGHTGDTLELDGCATAVYKENGKEVFSGSYSAADSIIGDTINGQTVQRTIVLVTSSSGEKRYFRLYHHVLLEGQPPIDAFEVMGETYTERQFVSDDGNLTSSYLVADGLGRAKVYEYVNKVMTVTSEGTYVLQSDGYSYVYTPDVTNGTTTFNHSKMVVSYANYLSNSRSLALAYFLSYEDDGKTTDLAERRYTDGDDESELVTVGGVVGVYITSEGVFSGLIGKGTTYNTLTNGISTVYFQYDEENPTLFYVLKDTPAVLSKRIDGSYEKGASLTLTWRELGNGTYEAVYVYNDADGNAVQKEGSYRETQILYPGVTGYLYTFTSDDGSLSFKFTVNMSSKFFNYIDANGNVIFATISELKEDGTTDKNVKITYTDELYDGKRVIVYSYAVDNDVTEIKGTFDTYETIVDGEVKTVVGKEVIPFGDENYKFNVYTFTSTDGNTSFKFTLRTVNKGTYFCKAGESGMYTDEDGNKLELNGDTHIAKYTSANGTESISFYLVQEGVLGSGKAIYMLIDGNEAYLDLGEADDKNTFSLRGEESGAYLVFKNGVPVGDTMIKFDGQSKAVVTIVKGDADNPETETIDATYTKNGELITVYNDKGNAIYTGKIGIVAIGGSGYRAFSLIIENVEGSYINENDLSVLVLDNAGYAVKYGSYGVKDEGYYFRIADDKLFYINAAETDAALYTIIGNKVIPADYNATYYSSDFASVVFYQTGIVIINNKISMYYSVEGNGVYTTYRASSGKGNDGANEYGYIEGEIVVNDDKIVYNDGTTERVYNFFDGAYITFTAENGDILEFQPDGEATFVVSAKLTVKKDDKKEETLDKYIGLDYDDDDKPYLYMADAVRAGLNGGSDALVYTRNFRLEFDYFKKTFYYNADEFKYGLTAIGYQYYSYYSTYGSRYETLFKSFYGIISIVGEQKKTGETAEVDYTVSGSFNFAPDKDGNALTFTNGTLSRAGYKYTYSNNNTNYNFGHMYVTEFTVGEDVYHLTFFLMPAQSVGGSYLFRVYSLTRVTNKVVIDEGKDTVLYDEELVYSEFNLPKGTDENGDAINYKKGEAFIPTLKFNGEFVVSYSYENNGNDWTLYGISYNNGKIAEQARYMIKTEKDQDGKTVSASVEKSVILELKTTNGDVVYVWYDGNKVIEIVGVTMKGEKEMTKPTTSNGNEEGTSFTVTMKGETYTVNFVYEENEESGKVIKVEIVSNN